MFLDSTSVVRITTFFAVALICISSFSIGAGTTLLPDEEVQALKEIGKKLGKAWNFSADPCSGQSGWKTSLDNDTANAVNCSFSATDSTWHVDSILLRSQGLPGVLPPELVRLPYLRKFDVSRNYLNGTIPEEWGIMPNVLEISVLGNRLTGPIPKELGNLSTLQSLNVEMNRLSGPLPSELGNLTLIKVLRLASNNFTGELPSSFAKLVALKDLRFSDNNFTGRIPDFMQNLTNLEKLFIQASGLQGPLPNFELLEKLYDLRISDLNGPEIQFPRINSSSIRVVMLRSCNLSGKLPEYLVDKNNLKTLDVSFNRLTGVIPTSYSKLLRAEYIFLTGNQLTGTVPDWLSEGKNIDISYNNFTIQQSRSECQDKNVNMFASSSEGSTFGMLACLSDRCSKPRYHNLYINCGGGEVTIGGIKYDDDSDAGAPSRFFSNSSYHWGYSTTGYFPDDNKEHDAYTQPNASTLSINNPQLYMSARLSPISLTYYAFCLINGNYTLSLHFAEITFTNDKNYSSLGRRIFNVYIQGKVKLKDFDIAAEAGGAAKEIVKNFTVVVTNSTLEIRFHWAGKGTVAMPYRTVYGPLISAISLNPNFIPPKESSNNRISNGIVAGIVVASICLVCLIIGILWWQGYLGQKETMEQDLKGMDLKTGFFTLRQIKAATNNFDPTNKIGEGGFGSVYKGVLLDGTVIAVKQLSSKSNQGNREFVNEVGMISALQHPHLVKLYGCCTEGNQLLLVYEYMENNSLARALFGPKEYQMKLDWLTRHKICVGIARGLAYLHEESRLKIVHRDIKTTNVLLNKDLIPKISDFGLAKLVEEDNTHISTRIAGTFGYMAPEYAMRGYLTDKADVYSFGIVTLEIICGRSNTTYDQGDECFYLPDWANMLKEKGGLIELVDPRLGSNFNKEEAMTMINVVFLCTNVSPAVRPTMSSVVSMLEGRIRVEAPPPHAALTIDEAKLVAMRKHFRGTLSEKVSEKPIQGFPIEGPQNASSISTNDMYPVYLDSDYLFRDKWSTM